MAPATNHMFLGSRRPLQDGTAPKATDLPPEQWAPIDLNVLFPNLDRSKRRRRCGQGTEPAAERAEAGPNAWNRADRLGSSGLAGKNFVPARSGGSQPRRAEKTPWPSRRNNYEIRRGENVQKVFHFRRARGLETRAQLGSPEMFPNPEEAFCSMRVPNAKQAPPGLRKSRKRRSLTKEPIARKAFNGAEAGLLILQLVNSSSQTPALPFELGGKSEPTKSRPTDISASSWSGANGSQRNSPPRRRPPGWRPNPPICNAAIQADTDFSDGSSSLFPSRDTGAPSSVNTLTSLSSVSSGEEAEPIPPRQAAALDRRSRDVNRRESPDPRGEWSGQTRRRLGDELHLGNIIVGKERRPVAGLPLTGFPLDSYFLANKNKFSRNNANCCDGARRRQQARPEVGPCNESLDECSCGSANSGNSGFALPLFMRAPNPSQVPVPAFT